MYLQWYESGANVEEENRSDDLVLSIYNGDLRECLKRLIGGPAAVCDS